MQLIDGKIASEAVKTRLAEAVKVLQDKGNRKPCLAAILVGNDGASETYIASKVRTCGQIGFLSNLIRFDAQVSEERLLEEVRKINADTAIDGLIVQLPLPANISAEKVILAIDPKKDVDGFHPINMGNLALGLPGFVSATPKGIMMLLEHFNIETAGKNAVIIGRSNIVGTPMSLLLSKNTNPGNCTVTLCHSKTKNLSSFIKQADIVVAALGRPESIVAEDIKEGAVVIDVGITRLDDSSAPKGYRIVGDVDFKNVAPKCSWITPVPGGVGLMTIAALMQNTFTAYLKNIEN
jgi:methylenetetrahydrofolate dehydrogenase (NADP+) / methenyltetrahydrofolate cyclohydrolase